MRVGEKILHPRGIESRAKERVELLLRKGGNRVSIGGRVKKGKEKGKVRQNRSINTINGSRRNPFLTRRIGEEGKNTIGSTR